MVEQDGFVLFETDKRVVAWAKAARNCAEKLSRDPTIRDANFRHGRTWFVGVDMLPNGPDGRVAGVPLNGPWEKHVPSLIQHKAQVSIIFPEYP